MGKAEWLILEALTEAFPDPLTKEEVAAMAGYEANGGGFNNRPESAEDIGAGPRSLRAADKP